MINAILQSLKLAAFFLLRYETEHVPCTGITAVTKQERRHFQRGVMIAPWHAALDQAKASIEGGAVIDTGLRYFVYFPKLGPKEVAVFRSNDDASIPAVYLAADDCFQGYPTPYDTPALGTDSLIFGLLVAELLRLAEAVGQWVSGADWQSVPALHLLRPKYPTLIVLHNCFDAYLGDQAQPFAPGYSVFCRGETALCVGLREADTATVVNQGFAIGLTQNPLHRLVTAHHLQHLVPRLVGVDNAAFSPLSSQQEHLLSELSEGGTGRLEELRRLKQAALSDLPAELRRMAKDRIVIISMGRRSAQKQHDVLVESLRELLRTERELPILAIFATTAGAPGAEQRQGRIEELREEFRDHVCCLNGRISYYSALVTLADFNVMCSLWEPHGAAFEGLMVPIARAVDGLLAQVSAFEPSGLAKSLNDRCHTGCSPSGFLFHEEVHESDSVQKEQYESLLNESPSPNNYFFRSIVASLSDTLRQAIDIRLHHEDVYANLVRGALLQQKSWSWKENFAMQLALVRDARNRRRAV